MTSFMNISRVRICEYLCIHCGKILFDKMVCFDNWAIWGCGYKHFDCMFSTDTQVKERFRPPSLRSGDEAHVGYQTQKLNTEYELSKRERWFVFVVFFLFCGRCSRIPFSWRHAAMCSKCVPMCLNTDTFKPCRKRRRGVELFVLWINVASQCDCSENWSVADRWCK